MRRNRGAFTLLEVLISIALLSLVLMALYSSLTMLRSSNAQLFEHLKKSTKEKKAVETLFLDIAGSFGKIDIKQDEFSRLCIDDSVNSLYNLASAKICWIVSKSDKTLLRTEGNRYKLPIESEEKVAVDIVMDNIEVFKVYYNDEAVLVALKQSGKEPISFMVQGIYKPIKKKRKKINKPPVKVTAPAKKPPPVKK
jgi:prepilin-type N-terminal cleavage/methylation domain-containing protein